MHPEFIFKSTKSFRKHHKILKSRTENELYWKYVKQYFPDITFENCV